MMLRPLALALLSAAAGAMTVPDFLAEKLQHPNQEEEMELHHMAHEDRFQHHVHSHRFLQESNPRCMICPEGQAMSKPDFVLPLDSEDDITCANARFIGAAGGIEEEDCEELADILASPAFCHCVPEEQTEENPVCSVCPEGTFIGRPDFVAAETSSGRELTCQDLDNLGFARELSPELCDAIANQLTGFSACRCLATGEMTATETPEQTNAPTPTTPVMTQAPTASPTEPPTTSPPVTETPTTSPPVTETPTAGAVMTQTPTQQILPETATPTAGGGVMTQAPTIGGGGGVMTQAPTTAGTAQCDAVMVRLKTAMGPVYYCCTDGDGDFDAADGTAFDFDNCTLLGGQSPLEPESTDVVIELSLTTDRHGQEVSFTLTDRSTGETLWDLPEPRHFFEKFTAYSFEIPVNPAGCYDFEILDSFGDGLSEGGEGGFKLYYSGEEVLSGVDFGEMAGVSMGDGCNMA